MSLAKENRPNAVEADSDMSMLGGADVSEPTSMARRSQVLPTPRTWRTAVGETSFVAGRTARAASSPTCKAILHFIEREGPLTAEQLMVRLHDSGRRVGIVTARARVSDLRSAGLLVDSGKRGRSAAGGKSICWALAAPGSSPPETTRIPRSDIMLALGFAVNELQPLDAVRFVADLREKSWAAVVETWPAFRIYLEQC
jgi:hypothetical protein